MAEKKCEFEVQNEGFIQIHETIKSSQQISSWAKVKQNNTTYLGNAHVKVDLMAPKKSYYIHNYSDHMSSLLISLNEK